ncbi:dienelactone hydrolase family protein [Shewanella nanhaiensis]|uniref:Dienelactone hydrolase family protein n=1 Tax=Shewanella nanhaiensis TaxID=2864872 RepID=A0ABS7E267_9GAMM|nr:dienelactone hydrolase family protein [Shewanella nanhaiensis]MBW8183256.1 dienelactone hydrolase family protein [Shewanella nanhaiensis]
MKVILITDIFGVTEHLLQIQQGIARAGWACEVLDPYCGVGRQFMSESVAYESFMAECGHKPYCDLVISKLETADCPCVVIGFSAGASAAWKALDRLSPDAVSQLIGFYPSQIRHHLAVNPSVPVSLVFPAFESHFDLGAVMVSLAKKSLLMLSQTQYGHGFINFYSSAYHKFASSQYIDLLCNPKLLKEPTSMQTELARLSDKMLER